MLTSYRKLQQQGRTFPHQELEEAHRTLQENNRRQLLEMSALRSYVEDLRLGLTPTGEKGGPVVAQLRQLKYDLLAEKEAREDAEQKVGRERLSDTQYGNRHVGNKLNLCAKIGQ